jgi:hypothetical protein
LDDFFWRPFPYTLVEATPLWRAHGESFPLSPRDLSCVLKSARASSDVCQILVVCERSHREMEGEKHMSSYVLGFQDIDKTKLMVGGGKGANLS